MKAKSNEIKMSVLIWINQIYNHRIITGLIVRLITGVLKGTSAHLFTPTKLKRNVIITVFKETLMLTQKH